MTCNLSEVHPGKSAKLLFQAVARQASLPGCKILSWFYAQHGHERTVFQPVALWIGRSFGRSALLCMLSTEAEEHLKTQYSIPVQHRMRLCAKLFERC